MKFIRTQTTAPALVRLWAMSLFAFTLIGCTGIPKGISPVTPFDAEKYLGTWYEIARLDHSFERGLSQVTAEYTQNSDGSIRVRNRGYLAKSDEWKVVEGKATFVSSPDTGHLKVSFFGPFYGSYVVFGLDQENYQYAFVTSYDKSFLWLLAREPVVSQEVIDRFLAVAKEHGFETDDLIFVDQD